MKRFRSALLGLLVPAVMGIITSGTALAEPTRDEAYRSDHLKITVFKDSTDDKVFWYLPPLKLYEDAGKVVFYKRPSAANDGKVTYYFYVVPYMTDDLIDMLAGEIPNLQDKSQLKPVIAKQFGIQVKQFNAAAMGDKITDYHYLNEPQLIKFDLDAAGAGEFDFFLNNKPGIQANVFFEYDSEKMDKYLNISLTYKEVYNALNIGATGRYTFTQAEISAAIEHYLSQKYFNVKSKGDIPIPDIVNRVIQECFTPFQRQNTRPNNPWGNGWNTWGNGTNNNNTWGNNNGWNNGNTWNNNNGWNNWFSGRAPTPDELKILKEQFQLYDKLAGDWTGGDDWGRPSGSSGSTGNNGGNNGGTNGPSGGTGGNNGGGNWGGNNGGNNGGGNWGGSGGWGSPGGGNGGWGNPGGGWGGGGNPGNNGQESLQFQFRKQVADSDKQFYYTQTHYADSTETSEIPVFLSLLPSVVRPHVLVTPLAKKDLVVETAHTKAAPVSAGINVEQDEQYIVNASFAMQAVSPYDKTMQWYRWQSTWPSVDEDLYYRVGTGPWNKVGGRTVIKAEGIYHGALQFYIDREHVWSKIPDDYKKAKLLGTIPAIFTFQKLYPQFNVSITGRKIEMAP